MEHWSFGHRQHCHSLVWAEKQKGRWQDTSSLRLECRRTIRSQLTGVSVQSVPVQSVPTHHCYTVRPAPSAPMTCFGRAPQLPQLRMPPCQPNDQWRSREKNNQQPLDLQEHSCGNLKIIHRKLPSLALKNLMRNNWTNMFVGTAGSNSSTTRG